MLESRTDDTFTEAQTDILRYWTALRGKDDLPRRKAFDPGAVLKHLRHISILELTERGQLACRILGSCHSRFDQTEPISAVQSLGIEAVLTQQGPVSGSRPVSAGTHHWLRLPLLSDCGRRLLILCHDEVLLERAGARRDSALSRSFSPDRHALAA